VLSVIKIHRKHRLKGNTKRYAVLVIKDCMIKTVIKGLQPIKGNIDALLILNVAVVDLFQNTFAN